MPFVPSRYRGSPTYFLVMAELVRAAQYRGLTTYQDVAVIMGIGIHGNYMGSATGQILGEISEDEVAAGRPMLSVVAVSVRGKAGPGFFDLARSLGRKNGNEADAVFWEKERQAVYRAWKRPLPKPPSST